MSTESLEQHIKKENGEIQIPHVISSVISRDSNPNSSFNKKLYFRLF